MIPFKEQVTPEQYDNAKKHWNALIEEKLPGNFEMSVFDNLDSPNDEYTCNTIACSAGWLPFTLNIDKSILPIINGEIDYNVITSKYLGLSYFKYEEQWRFCFSLDWGIFDNTAKGAGKRMQYLYEVGLPSNWMDIMDGKDDYPWT